MYTKRIDNQFLAFTESHSQILDLFILSPMVLKNYYLNLILIRPQDLTTFHPDFLKETAHYIAPLLIFIFQSSINQGKLPVDWKDAFVVPAYKKGRRTTAANYRPISLTSICCKILEHVIHSFIFLHIDSNKILCDHQHGFQPNHMQL